MLSCHALAGLARGRRAGGQAPAREPFAFDKAQLVAEFEKYNGGRSRKDNEPLFWAAMGCSADGTEEARQKRADLQSFTKALGLRWNRPTEGQVRQVLSMW